MPKRNDLKKILIIGSGPIIISQACEFDYSGTQACKALKEEGYEVVLINSNPATIMNGPGNGGSDLCGTHHTGGGGENYFQGTARCTSADPLAVRRA